VEAISSWSGSTVLIAQTVGGYELLGDELLLGDNGVATVVK